MIFPLRDSAPLKPHHKKKRCLLLMGVIMVLTVATIITFLTVFKAHDATVQITAISLPTFTVHNNTLNATLALAVAIHNPNREGFQHLECLSRLFYHRDPVGRAVVPAENIEAKGDERFVVVLEVEGGRRVVVSPRDIVSGRVFLVATTTVAGVVRVLSVFEHHAVTASHCEVVVFVANATIQSFSCQHGMKI